MGAVGKADVLGVTALKRDPHDQILYYFHSAKLIQEKKMIQEVKPVDGPPPKLLLQMFTPFLHHGNMALAFPFYMG